MIFNRVYYPNGNVHYEGYSKSKKFSNQKLIDHVGIFINNLEGHVRRYDPDGNLIETLRLKDGVRIPLKRVEQRQTSTEYPELINIGKEKPCFDLVKISECYSGEIDQFGKECGKGIFFYNLEFKIINEQNEEELISLERRILYVGEFREGKRCGHGSLYNKDGTLLYKGKWKNDRPHGQGVSYHSNGCPFVDGIWKGGNPSSDCTVHDENHILIYQGLWEHYDKHGFRFDFKTGEILYDGMFRHGLPHGKGMLILIQYCQWFAKNGALQGPIKRFVDGNFHSGELSGYGVLRLGEAEDDCTLYEGNFEHGEHNGFGIDCSYNYIGHFRNNLREGYGKLFDTESDITIENYHGTEKKDKTIVHFEGLFRNNSPCNGKMYFENGELMYEGAILYDETRGETFEHDYSTSFGFYHGFGKSFYPSGKLWYAGQWEYGLQVGEGTFYSEDGLEIRKNECKDGAWYGYGIYYGNSRHDTVLYNGLLRNGLPHGDGVIFEYDYDLETDVRSIKSVFGGEFFNGKYYEDGIMYNAKHCSVFKGKVDENGEFVDGVQYLNDEFDTTIQWKNGKVFDEKHERMNARERLCLSTYLENGNPSMINQVSKSVCKKMYREMFGNVPKTSKKSLIRQMIHYRKMQNKSSSVMESSDIDLFGNEIVSPVQGNDGQIYELQSMMKLFAINEDHEYTTIKYHYDDDNQRVPNFPNTGFAKPLSGFYLSPQICQQLSLVLTHEQMNARTVQFFTACETGDLEKVKEMLENGVHFDEIHYTGMNSLLCAFKNGNLDIVKYLVQKGFNVNADMFMTNYDHVCVNEIILQPQSREKPFIVLGDTTPILCQKFCKEGNFYGKYDFEKVSHVSTESEQNACKKIYSQMKWG